MKAEKSKEGFSILIAKGDLTPGRFAFLGHIRGLLENEFGRKQVVAEIEVGEQRQSAIGNYYDDVVLGYEPLKDMVKGLLSEVNKGAGVRYSLKDIAYISFEFVSDREGGKIVLCAHSTEVVEGCESEKVLFRACKGDGLVMSCGYCDDAKGCMKYREDNNCMKVCTSGKVIVKSTFSAVGVRLHIAGRELRW